MICIVEILNNSSVEIKNLVILKNPNNPDSIFGVKDISNLDIRNVEFYNLIDHDSEYPENQEYYIKIEKEDTVIKSHTDKRGYPLSCGVENKDKDITIIIRGTKEQPLNVSLYDTEHCYGFDFVFENKTDLDSFLTLNPRFEIKGE